jgi:hypothetical protein
VLPTRPGEQQRCSTLTPADVLAFTGDQRAAWGVFEAVRRLDRQTFNEWALGEPQRTAHDVASRWEQEYGQHGRDGELDGGYVECTPRITPSRPALVACDPHASAVAKDAAREVVLSNELSADRKLIGECVRASLRRWEEYLLESDRTALSAYWHLAARLGQEELDIWCDDGQGKNRRLRVCQLKGNVFRGRKTARFDKRLRRRAKDNAARAGYGARRVPPEPVQATIGSHHVAAYVGPLYRPKDPFAPEARTVRFYAPCLACGELFTAGTSKQTYCDACGSDAGRKSRSRQAR